MPQCHHITDIKWKCCQSRCMLISRNGNQHLARLVRPYATSGRLLKWRRHWQRVIEKVSWHHDRILSKTVTGYYHRESALKINNTIKNFVDCQRTRCALHHLGNCRRRINQPSAPVTDNCLLFWRISIDSRQTPFEAQRHSFATGAGCASAQRWPGDDFAACQNSSRCLFEYLSAAASNRPCGIMRVTLYRCVATCQ